MHNNIFELFILIELTLPTSGKCQHSSFQIKGTREALQEGNGTPLHTLTWKIPRTEEPGRLQSMRSLRVHMTEQLHFHFSFHALEKEMATHSSVLAWGISGTGEPGGLLSLGSHRVGHD